MFFLGLFRCLKGHMFMFSPLKSVWQDSDFLNRSFLCTCISITCLRMTAWQKGGKFPENHRQRISDLFQVPAVTPSGFQYAEVYVPSSSSWWIELDGRSGSQMRSVVMGCVDCMMRHVIHIVPSLVKCRKGFLCLMTCMGIRMLVDLHQKVQWHHWSAEASIALRADPDLILAAVIFSVTHVTQKYSLCRWLVAYFFMGTVSLKIREFPKFETPPFIYLFLVGDLLPYTDGIFLLDCNFTYTPSQHS